MGHQATLGQTRQSFIQLFSKAIPGIVFEEALLNDGRSRIISEVSKPDLIIDVIGPAWGPVEQVSVSWTPAYKAEGQAIALKVLRHVFYERKAIYTNWFKKAVTAEQALDIRDGLLTTLKPLKVLGMISLSIRPIPDKYTFFAE